MSCLRISHEDDASDGVGGRVPLSHQEGKSVLLEGNEFQLELLSRLGDGGEVASHLHPLVFPFKHFNVTRLRHFRKVLLPYNVYHSSNSSSSFFVKEEAFYHILQLSVPSIMGHAPSNVFSSRSSVIQKTRRRASVVSIFLAKITNLKLTCFILFYKLYSLIIYIACRSLSFTQMDVTINLKLYNILAS
jgi:hypothetical protein